MDIFKHHHTNNQGQVVHDPVQAPEIDPSASVTALTVLAMIVAIITSKRN